MNIEHSFIFQPNLWSSLPTLLGDDTADGDEDQVTAGHSSDDVGSKKIDHDHSYWNSRPEVGSDDDMDTAEPENTTDRKFKFYCDPPCPAGFDKKSNLDRHKDSRGCYHKRPFVCDTCNQRFCDQETKDQHYSKGRCLAV